MILTFGRNAIGGTGRGETLPVGRSDDGTGHGKLG
jgi:hypothetical protein